MTTVEMYNKSKTDELLAAKQDVLTAGTGIDITNNVISAGDRGWTKYTGNTLYSDLCTYDSTLQKYVTKCDIYAIYKGNTTNGYPKSNIFIPKGNIITDFSGSYSIQVRSDDTSDKLEFLSFKFATENGLNGYARTSYKYTFTTDGNAVTITKSGGFNWGTISTELDVYYRS